MKTLVTQICLVLALLASQPLQAKGLAPVSVNGIQLTQAQWRALEATLGGPVPPGHYLTNPQGCWVNLTTGASGCLNGGGGDVHSRYGSGSRDGRGSWNHWSNAAGGAVGGTSDGCIYTSFGWSNC